MKLRTLIFWPHLIAGVVAGVVILIMSVTGVILTYERQLIAWSNGHLQSTPPAEGAARLPSSRPAMGISTSTSTAAGCWALVRRECGSS
jgi:uncharacterized iron-regulated membrane protein